MKHRYLFILCCCLFSPSLFAQDIKGGMENWRNYSVGIFPPIQLEAPQGWYGLDSLIAFGAQLAQLSGTANIKAEKQVFKSTDAHSGDYAAKLVSKTLDTFGVIPGILSNAKIDIDFMALMGGGDPLDNISYSGGAAILNRVTGIEARVKFETTGADSGAIMVSVMLSGAAADGGDSLIGAGFSFVEPSNNYVLMTTPIIYNDSTSIPDKLIVGFISSASSIPVDGSTLFVDDVKITGDIDSGIPSILASNHSNAVCFPNPTHGKIVFLSGVSPVNMVIYDLSGRIMHQSEWSDYTSVDCNEWADGIYLYQLYSQQGTSLHNGKFLLSR